MKTLIVIFLFSIFITETTEAQRFLGSATIGLNMSQIDGDEVVGYKKPGLYFGGQARLPLGKNFSTSVEIAFSQKGAYQKYPIESDPTKELPYYNIRLNYLDVPILVHYEDKNFILAGLGFSVGRLVSLKEYEWGIPTDASIINKTYKTNDYSVLVDLGFLIFPKARLHFRYSYSMAKIRTRTYTDTSGQTWEREQFNNLLSLRISYTFNEKKKQN